MSKENTSYKQGALEFGLQLNSLKSKTWNTVSTFSFIDIFFMGFSFIEILFLKEIKVTFPSCCLEVYRRYRIYLLILLV